MLPDYVTRPFRLYANFQGRSGRREYWCFFVVFYAILLVAIGVASAIDDKSKQLQVSLFAIFTLPFILPALALAVRRFHDFDASGWWVLASAIPYLNLLVDLFLAFKAGDATENRFGPDPRLPAEAS